MISFFVPGMPKPGGSKKAFVIGGRARIVDACAKNKEWRAVVSLCAAEAMIGTPMFDGVPLDVSFTFYLPRPKGHFGKKGLKPNAPPFPLPKPDVLKLARSTEDACSTIVWRDDSANVTMTLRKRYVSDGAQIGCAVQIKPELQAERISDGTQGKS